MQIIESLQINKEPPSFLSWDMLPSFSLLKVISFQSMQLGTDKGIDALLQVEYAEQCFTFAAEYKNNWQDRSFQYAIMQVKKYQNQTKNNEAKEYYPLIILPYLSEKHLDFLAEEQVSGLDLCGNCLIIVPGQWLIRQSGKPNRFQITQSLRNPYQGKASLVGRVLLQTNEFRKIDDLYNEILKCGGDISLALVSRAVQRLEEDVITIKSKDYRVKLVQPENLLKSLMNGYDPKKAKCIWRGKMAIMPDALPTLFAFAKQQECRMVVTGMGAATRYANLAMERTVRLYIEPSGLTESLINEWGAVETNHFVNLEIYSAPDSTCFFGSETDESGVIWASALQSYLEMMNSGDIRLKESASQIREQLLMPKGNTNTEEKIIGN